MGSYELEQCRKLFIGGLSQTTTNESLKNFFKKFGDVVNVVVMEQLITKKSRGFGFITYSHSAMVNQAMLNRPHIIDGREVDTKLAISRLDIARKEKDKVNAKKMFVCGIKKQSEIDLFEYFGRFGIITNIRIITDLYTGRRRGFGFIEYIDTNSIDRALLIKTHQVAGSKLEVDKATMRGERGGGGHGSDGRGGVGNRNHLGENHPSNDQWGVGGHDDKSNGGGGGNGNSGMEGGYVTGDDGVYGGSAGGYNSNSGEAWQGGSGCGSSAGGYNSNSGEAWQGGSGCGDPQSWGNSDHAWGHQDSVGNGWGNFQQPSNNCNNWGANQNYGGGGVGPMKSYYTPYNRSAPYRYPGAGNANAGNAGGFGQNPGQWY